MDLRKKSGGQHHHCRRLGPHSGFCPLIQKDPRSVYGNLLPMLQAADLSLANLEAPLSDIGRPATKSGAVFKGEAKDVLGLGAVPFDAVTLANNHMFDYGLSAFQETLDVLDQNKIKHVGAGMDLKEAQTPLILTAQGINIAIVNFSEGEDLTGAGKGPGVMGWDIPALEAQIKRLKQNTDLVIVVAHCSLEYIPFAPPYVMSAFKQLAEAGADAVIGHHPHVPQGILIHQGVPICCSLGNFVFFQPTDFFWRKLGYMVKIGVCDKGTASLEVIPYKIHDLGISGLDTREKQIFFNRLKDISSPLETQAGIKDAWKGFLSYYGADGFKNEVAMIMEKLSSDPGKGAAMFRNRLTTNQHLFHL
ncbi:MAG: CapA family protein [Desulfobacter sp.]|nr:MAG: CapA family protein [Desulfobacter sp.]